MLPTPSKDQPFWVRMLIVGFAAFGATFFAGMVSFFLLNVVGRKPPSPPPTASVPPPAPQQQATPPPPAQAELGLASLPTEAQVKAAVAARRVENENSQLSGSEADLTDYANKQISLAKIYLSKTQGHLDSAKQAALSRDIPSSCNDFKAAAGSATAIFNSVEPVAKEIKLKRPEMIESILTNGQTLVDNIEVALAECERLGF